MNVHDTLKQVTKSAHVRTVGLNKDFILVLFTLKQSVSILY